MVLTKQTVSLLMTVALVPASVNAFKWITHRANKTPRRFASLDDSIFGSFEEGKVRIPRGEDDFFSLYYRIYNDNKQSSSTKKKPPLVVLHGGPSLPSQYLYPMVPNLNPDRSVLFYDQLGCGKSEEPKDKKFYSISQSVEDLDTILQNLAYGKIHLFGHSYGGCLAYEYAKKRPDKIQSLILSNTATNMKAAGDSYDRLALKNPLGFWKQNVCSVQSPALDDALKHAGSIWAGMDVVIDYVASPPTGGSFPNTLVMTCPKDFGFESSRYWKTIILKNGAVADVDEVSLEKCAHYPHLEDGDTFGRAVNEFLSKNDN